MDDSELLAALAVNLDGAFERLVVAYGDRLFRFGLRLSGNPQDAEEVAQDAFVRVYQALQAYPPDQTCALQLRPWLYRIALNVFRNRVRRKRLRIEPLDGTSPLSEEGDGPEQLALHGERAAELASQIARLPQRYRAAVILRHVEDLSYAEIATVLEQPVGTVKANVHRGVLALRQALSTAEPSPVVFRGAGIRAPDDVPPHRFVQTANAPAEL